MALMGLAFSSERQSTACENLQIPGGFRFTKLIGGGITRPIDITDGQIVMFHQEYRQGFPAHMTRVDLLNDNGSTETIWVTENRHDFLRCFGRKFAMLTFHVPEDTIGDQPDDREHSSEVRAFWVNPDHVTFIGPSSMLHHRRRRLGKIHLRNNTSIEIYESLNTLKKLFERQIRDGTIKEIEEASHPRDL